MKVFYIDPQSYNNLGDYDKYLLENIDSEKYFYCSDKLSYSEINQTVLRRIYFYGNYKHIKRIFSYMFSQCVLIREIKKIKPDVIHFQWYKIPFVDLLLMKLIKRVLPNITIVHTAHNVLPHDTGAKYVKIYSRIYQFVDGIIVHAKVTKDEIVDKFKISKDKIFVIPHGFLPSKIKINRTEDGITRFSFIGFLCEYKGLDILLKAWCSSPKILENKSISLLIAGAGKLPCLDDIPKNKNIILENYFHSEEDLCKIIANTDIAVLPYRKISQSGVLLTYLAEKKPIIVSNIGGLTQPFEFGIVGWILNDLTVDSIQEVILQVIDNRAILDNIANDVELWNRIFDYYEWKNISKKTFSLYKELRGE